MWGFKVYTIDWPQPDTTGVSWYLLSSKIDWCLSSSLLTELYIFLYQHKLKDIIQRACRKQLIDGFFS